VQAVENIKNFYDFGIQDIISNSNEAFIQLKNTLDFDLSDDKLKSEVFSKISKSIEEIKNKDVKASNYQSSEINSKSNNKNFDASPKWLNELKIFIANMLKHYFEIVYKLVTTSNEFEDQKIKWQNTLDQIIRSHEDELYTSKKLSLY